MRWTIGALLAAAAALPAQYALSAMAGYIHHAEGQVWLGDRAIAPKPDDFEHVIEGRRLRTGDGKAEILLVPGSFVRVGERSEIEMVSAGLTSATLRLVRGALIVDLQTFYEKDSIAILAGESEIRFRKPGVYRIGADPPSLRVLEGRARVLTGDAEADVKGGRTAALGAATAPAPPDAPPDALDEWNAARHERLAALTERARQERWDGMSAAERDLLRMLLRRGEPMLSQPQREPRAQPRSESGPGR